MKSATRGARRFDGPAGEKQAVALLGVFDLSYEEAAKASGLPVGTMKSRLSRGRQRLRTLMEESRAK